MNERLREFYNFKSHPLKSSLTLLILLILNIVLYSTIYTSLIKTGILSIGTIALIFVAIVELVYVIGTFIMKRERGESWGGYVFKLKGVGLFYFILICFVALPLIYLFYALVNGIIDLIKGLNDTIIRILLYISAVLIAAGIWWFINYLIARGNAKSEEETPLKKVNGNVTIKKIFDENKIDNYEFLSKGKKEVINKKTKSKRK